MTAIARRRGLGGASVTIDAPSDPVARWRADTGVTDTSGTATTWADQSGNGYDISSPFGTTSAPDIATSPSGDVALEFSSPDILIRGSGTFSAMPSGNEPRTVIACVQFQEATPTSVIAWGTDGGEWFGVGVNSLGNLAIYGGTTDEIDTGILVVGQGWRVITVRTGGFQGAVEASAGVDFGFDGVGFRTYNTDAATQIATGRNFPTSSGTAPEYDLCEVVVYARRLNNTEAAGAARELYDRWLATAGTATSLLQKNPNNATTTEIDSDGTVDVVFGSAFTSGSTVVLPIADTTLDSAPDDADWAQDIDRAKSTLAHASIWSVGSDDLASTTVAVSGTSGNVQAKGYEFSGTLTYDASASVSVNGNGSSVTLTGGAAPSSDNWVAVAVVSTSGTNSSISVSGDLTFDGDESRVGVAYAIGTSSTGPLSVTFTLDGSKAYAACMAVYSTSGGGTGNPPPPADPPPGTDDPVYPDNPVLVPAYSAGGPANGETYEHGVDFTYTGGVWESDGRRNPGTNEPADQRYITGSGQATLDFRGGAQLRAGRLDNTDRAFMNQNSGDQETVVILTGERVRTDNMSHDRAVFPGDIGPHTHPGAFHKEPFWTSAKLRNATVREIMERTRAGRGFRPGILFYWPEIFDPDGNFPSPPKNRNVHTGYLRRPGNVAHIQGGPPKLASGIDVYPFPQGLRMATFKQSFAIHAGDIFQTFTVVFPCCWNGRDLWLPEGAHMAHLRPDGTPPDTHPIVLPQYHHFISTSQTTGTNPLSTNERCKVISEIDHPNNFQWDDIGYFPPHAEIMICMDPCLSEAFAWMANNDVGLGRLWYA